MRLSRRVLTICIIARRVTGLISCADGEQFRTGEDYRTPESGRLKLGG